MATARDEMESQLEEQALLEQLAQEFDAPDTDDSSEPGEDRALTEDEILSILSKDIEDSLGGDYSSLREDRLLANAYYRGDPRGDEEEGRSAVQSTDVTDVIEWMMPTIMESLMDPNGVVSFDPRGEEDESQADLETEATNYVFSKRCNGFVVLHEFVKDALLERNGVVKVYQCQQNKVKRETYEGQNDVEMQALLSGLNEQDQIIEHRSYQEQSPPQLAPVLGPTIALHDITIRRRLTDSVSKVECIPNSEFLLNSDHTSIILDEARFTGHRRVTTIGALVDEGWSIEELEDLPPYSIDEDEERSERFEREMGSGFGTDGEGSDLLSRTVQITECYRKFDLYGDGVPELFQCFVGGQTGSFSLLSMEPWDRHPFCGTTPILMSHKFTGMSIYDRARMIADQKTGIWRSILDNLYLQNNSRVAAVVGQVNLDDLLTSRPGGVVRQKAPGMVEPLITPPVGQAAYTALEYLDKVRDGRTGVSPEGAEMGMIPGNSPAHSVERLMTAKEKLVGLIVRVLAETGVKPMMLILRELLTKHQNQPLPVPIRGKWTTVNPTEWKERGGATVKVGLGTGDRMKQQMLIREVIGLQAQVASGGGLGVLVTHDHMHRALEDYVRFSSIGRPEDYWQDPKSDEAKKFIQEQAQRQQEASQKENQMEASIIKLQAELESKSQENDRMKTALEAQGRSAELVFKYEKLYQEMATKLTELEVAAKVDLSQQNADNKAGVSDGAA